MTRTAVCALAAAGALATAVAPATAAPAPRTESLYAPSALVLTVARGETAAAATPLRAVTLVCSPGAGGSHPDPKAACAELKAVDGEFRALGDQNNGRPCVKIYDPVVVTAQGVWDGRRVQFERTFSNSCVMQAEGTSVYSF
ncbi:subtilase-type protease inhibitor [Streptomyces sp. LP05-1]|uniref:Probable subtilase-type protease inhibitor n=1 Tax=Streptomyces pyxinae TaxID=2970734 RepID=A0ABT2CE36_9ACTN|nr:subtilase-type protease inhibitor [Streptomyces sp. LP05-1]MCS0634909.1 subtilase-type protease inhibitor [Streptomyces sp. LP05-1]